MIARLVFVVLLWPCLAWADDLPLLLPALYDISDVPQGDHLNIRSLPNASAATVGKIPYDAERIEVISLSRQGNWALVNHNDTSGWVSFRFLTRTTHEVNTLGLPQTLSCFGTEPFWSLKFSEDQVVLSLPDAQPDSRYIVTSISPTPENMRLHETGARYNWEMNGDSYHASIVPGLCSDGMSDRTYGFHHFSEFLGLGCCSLSTD